MAEVVIRPGTASDVIGMSRLGQAVIPTTYADIDAAYGRHVLETWWTPEAIGGMVADRDHVVATRGADLVGVANLGPYEDKSVMFRLYVHPEFQGQGIGSSLLRQIVELNGDRPLWLQRIDGNDTAAAFYAAHDFEEVAAEPNPPYRDQIWMRRAP